MRRVDFDPLRQFVLANFICLEVHQPDFLWQQHDQVRQALHHDKFGFHSRLGFYAGDGRQFRRTETRGEGQFAPDIGRLRADFSSRLRTPKRRDVLQIQCRALVRRQNLFPLQPSGFRFERRHIVRVFQRDLLKKFVVRRTRLRRAQFRIIDGWGKPFC